VNPNHLFHPINGTAIERFCFICVLTIQRKASAVDLQI